MRFRERAAEHREVLGEHEHLTAVHRAPAGDDAVAGDLRLVDAEIGAAVGDEGVEFLEAALVHEQIDALARGELAALVLRLDARVAPALVGGLAAPLQLVLDVLHAAAPA